MATKWNMLFFAISLQCVLLCVLACWWFTALQPLQNTWEILTVGISIGVFAAINGVIAATSLHISSFQISKFHVFSDIVTQYMLDRLQWFSLIRGRRRMERIWRESQKEQNRLLLNKMANDTDTEYGKIHNFCDITSLDEFRRRHPITRYEHYMEYLNRITKGETNVLTKETLKRFGLTAGTTGQTKIIPMMPSRSKIDAANGLVMNSIISKHFAKFSPLQKWMTTYTAPRPLITPGGTPIGPMDMYTEDQKMFIGVYSSPFAAFCIANDFAATYIHLLFSLRDAAVSVWITSHTRNVKKAMLILESNWQLLLNDLSSGTLNQGLQISEEIRNDCQAELTPDPVRAAHLKTEFEKGFDGIVARIWPQLSHVVAVDITNITKQLQRTYFKGIPIYNVAYAATEADIGLNISPNTTTPSQYVLLPNSTIYEFIPEKNIMEEQPNTLLLNEVEKGKSYEVVITPNNGLCRYRLGDVVKVVDFHFNTPVVQFCYRTAQLLNLSGENLTTPSMQSALTKVVAQWKDVELENWTCAESTLLSIDLNQPEDDTKKKQTRELIDREASEKYYFIFIEFKEKFVTISKKKSNQFDSALKDHCDAYRNCRDTGSICSPTLLAVPRGTFRIMEEYIVTHSAASFNQFKLPRKINNPYMLHYLVDANNSTEKNISA